MTNSKFNQTQTNFVKSVILVTFYQKYFSRNKDYFKNISLPLFTLILKKKSDFFRFVYYEIKMYSIYLRLIKKCITIILNPIVFIENVICTLNTDTLVHNFCLYRGLNRIKQLVNNQIVPMSVLEPKYSYSRNPNLNRTCNFLVSKSVLVWIL